MKPDFQALKNQLEGKVIHQVILPDNSEEGLMLILDDGATLQFGWSGCKLDGKEIDLQTIKTP